ncbi:MAG TPA: response regulator [Burkholderiaceae bacterium]|nr:response regulator [Burkholderiaceae bacterium]
MDRDASTDNPGRILIIDDAAAVSEVLALKLGREGFVTAVARNAQSAGELLERDEFDVVLLDVQLPDGSGFDLLARIRQRHSLLDLPIIMISGFDQTSDVVAALRNGANDYITKPFDLGVALARVRTQLVLKRLKQTNDRFMRIASHDLKKPLLVMLDAARHLQTNYPVGTALDQDAQAVLATLIDSGEFMQHIIADLLELRALNDRRAHVSKLPTDFGAIVRQAVVRNKAYALGKGAELRMEFEHDLPIIKADDTRIMQVLENLIGNAIKFGPAGNIITVRTRREHDRILCEVSDAGPGIPQNEMAQLFKEYARLSNLPTGGEKSSGLGLAICRELVTLHGGEIGAHNNPDGGSTFWFRLPAG